MTEAPPEDVATLPGPFLVPSVVVVSNALDAFKHLGIFTAEDPSDSEASDSPAATPLSGQDGGAKVDGGERGRDSEVVQMPRVESSVNLTWSVFGHHGRGGGLRRGRGSPSGRRQPRQIEERLLQQLHLGSDRRRTTIKSVHYVTSHTLTPHRPAA